LDSEAKEIKAKEIMLHVLKVQYDDLLDNYVDACLIINDLKDEVADLKAHLITTLPKDATLHEAAPEVPLVNP
jgi:hypothetical protein